MDTATFNTITELASILLTVGGGIWFLSTRMERLRASMATETQLVSERVLHITAALSEMSTGLKEARDGRVQLWAEINGLRERMAAAEAVKEK